MSTTSGANIFFMQAEEQCQRKSNADHLRLRDMTKMLITDDIKLIDFGLQLGCTFNEIKQKITNHPRSIEAAAMAVAAEWWDSSKKTFSQKVQIVLAAVEGIGEGAKVPVVKDILLKSVKPATCSLHERNMTGENSNKAESVAQKRTNSNRAGHFEQSLRNSNTAGHSEQKLRNSNRAEKVTQKLLNSNKAEHLEQNWTNLNKAENVPQRRRNSSRAEHFAQKPKNSNRLEHSEQRPRYSNSSNRYMPYMKTSEKTAVNRGKIQKRKSDTLERDNVVTNVGNATKRARDFLPSYLN